MVTVPEQEEDWDYETQRAHPWFLIGVLAPAVFLSVRVTWGFPAGPAFLLAIGGVIVYPLRLGHGIPVNAAIAIGFAIAGSALMLWAEQAWNLTTHVNWIGPAPNPFAAIAFAAQIAFAGLLWHKCARDTPGTLFVSIGALLAVVHFELSVAFSGISLLWTVLGVAAIVLPAIALGFAISSITRGATATGIAAAILACGAIWRVLFNGLAGSWQWAGYWGGWVT